MSTSPGWPRIQEWANAALKRAGRPVEVPPAPKVRGLSMSETDGKTVIELPRGRIGQIALVIAGIR